MILTGHAEIAALRHRPERNNAIVTVKSQITNGAEQVLSVSLDAVIHSRAGHRLS
jgi:hypothetical protein